jgi:hypothetical protein
VRGLHAAEADRAFGAGSTREQVGRMTEDTMQLHPMVAERGRTGWRSALRADTTVLRRGTLGMRRAAAHTSPARLELRRGWGLWCRRWGLSSAPQRKRDRTTSGWRRERRRQRQWGWGWRSGWAGRWVSWQAAAVLSSGQMKGTHWVCRVRVRWT